MMVVGVAHMGYESMSFLARLKRLSYWLLNTQQVYEL